MNSIIWIRGFKDFTSTYHLNSKLVKVDGLKDEAEEEEVIVEDETKGGKCGWISVVLCSGMSLRCVFHYYKNFIVFSTILSFFPSLFYFVFIIIFPEGWIIQPFPYLWIVISRYKGKKSNRYTSVVDC